LGGGFTSRLTDEIRVNRSLTYGIGASFDRKRFGGDFSVSTFTKIETTRALLDAVRDVLRKTATQGFTAAELKKVQGYLAGLFAIRVQTPQALAAQLADIAFFGLPDDYLQTVPAETARGDVGGHQPYREDLFCPRYDVGSAGRAAGEDQNTVEWTG
jgi:zinc protease